MLVLSRKPNESIVVRFSREDAQQLLDSQDADCVVTFTISKISGNKVAVGVDAPRSVNVSRKELTQLVAKSVLVSSGPGHTAQPAQPPRWPTE